MFLNDFDEDKSEDKEQPKQKKNKRCEDFICLNMN